MFQLGKILVSEEIIKNDFVCNLSACKGACCIDGEAGAPVEPGERDIMEKIYPKVKPYLRKEGIEAIEKQGIIMIVFLFLGKEILNLIGIDVNSFAVAGSFILFFLALEMILGISLYKDDAPETASVVPLAFPLIAGAGTMTSLVSLQAEYETVNIIVAIVINIIFVYLVLKSSGKIERILGSQGINVIRKVFGVILLAIAVKLFAANIQSLFS